jgi:hypothetical protein
MRTIRLASMRTLGELTRAARCLPRSVQFGRCYLSGGLFVVSVKHGRLDLVIHRSHPDWAV